MYHMDANEMQREKARRELPKNATCCLNNFRSSTPQNSSCTATYLPYHKPSKEDKQEAHEKTITELQELISMTTILEWLCTYLHKMLSVAKLIEISDDLVRHKFLLALPSTISSVIVLLFISTTFWLSLCFCLYQQHSDFHCAFVNINNILIFIVLLFISTTFWFSAIMRFQTKKTLTPFLTFYMKTILKFQPQNIFLMWLP